MSEESFNILVGSLTSAAEDLSLEEMLAQITEDNLHEEIDFGLPVGKESGEPN